MYFVILAINLLVGIGTLASGDSQFTEYYQGTASTTALDPGVPESAQAHFLLKRETNRETSSVSETLTFVSSAGKLEESTGLITVVDGKNGDLSYMNANGTVTGSGKALGSEWAWTRWDMNLAGQNGESIEDKRFISKQKQIMRKTVSRADTKSPLYLWEAEFSAISRDEYQSELSRMLPSTEK